MVNFSEKEKEFLPGETIAGYSVLSRIGSGSYGCLYFVKDISGGSYALKILKKNSGREFSALQKYREIPPVQGLTAIHAAGRLPDGRIYYLMDAADDLHGNGIYLPDTLANRLARQGHFQTQEVLDLAMSLLPALRHLHEHGAAHYDIKPENIIYIHQTPLLADFGSLDLCSTAEGFPSGTSGFYPPEELSGTVNGHFSPKNDLYALGMTLYCAWSGHSPEDYPMLPDDVDADGIRIIRKLLQRACDPNPAYRFQCADEFLKAVSRAERAMEAPSIRRRKRLRTMLIFFVFIALAVLSFFFVKTIRDENAFRKNLENMKLKTALAAMAENAGILSELTLAKEIMPESDLKRTNAFDTMEQFQKLHDLFLEYEKWKRLPEKEQKKASRKLIVMAESCPGSYRDPREELQSFLLSWKTLSDEEKELLRKIDTQCINEYHELQLTGTAIQKNPNLTPAEREKLTESTEKRLMELKKKYPLETEYAETCGKLRFADGIRDIIALRRKINVLKIRLTEENR